MGLFPLVAVKISLELMSELIDIGYNLVAAELEILSSYAIYQFRVVSSEDIFISVLSKVIDMAVINAPKSRESLKSLST